MEQKVDTVETGGGPAWKKRAWDANARLRRHISMYPAGVRFSREFNPSGRFALVGV